MKSISKKIFVTTFLILILIVSALPVLAQIEGLEDFGKAADYVPDANPRPNDPAEIAGEIIGIVLSVLGVIAVILILYSGFIWMTAAGNTEKIEKAKKILGNAVVGLIIILMAYSITYFVTTKLLEATK